MGEQEKPRTSTSAFRRDHGRTEGPEGCKLDADGFMRRRIASINDRPIQEGERKYRWPLGRRPDDHPGLSELDL